MQYVSTASQWFRCVGWCAVFIALTFLVAKSEGADTTKRPNVIIIFIDDMGYGDVGFNGAEGPRTPNLDKMASEGTRFDSFYVGCAVCSGSRTSLMTGCHYQRLSMNAVLFPNSDNGLHPDEITIADMLRETGYRTACVGKWHLGHLPPCLPTYQGFETYFGVPYSNDMWIDPANKLSNDILIREGLTLEEVKAGHKKKNQVPLMRGDEVIEYPANQKTLTKRYTEESIRFIRDNKDEPFFLYLPHTMVHLPLAVSKEFENRTDKLIWDAIEEVDWSVGEILATLKSLGIDEKTFVLFTSDNGAAVGSSLPLRAKKASVYDGGIREPTVMWWPGTIPAGRVCKEIAGTIDMLPTLATWCDGKSPTKKIDGKDIGALILDESGAKSPHEHYVLMHKEGTLRSGPWKFYPWRDKGNKGVKDYVISKDPVQLYNVEDDIGERTNVASHHPELISSFQAVFDAHVAEITANRRPTESMSRPPGAISPNRPSVGRKDSKPLNWSKVKIGDTFESRRSANIANRPFQITATVEGNDLSGMIMAQGGEIVGYSLYIEDGDCVFALRLSGSELHRARTPIGEGKSTIYAGLNSVGLLTLRINGLETETRIGGLIKRHPSEALCIGHDDGKPVDNQAPTSAMNGKLLELRLDSTAKK